jgi:hypothetical protein
MKRPKHYLSYLLRLWQSGKGREATWRASLESSATGERQGFASLKDLFAFLEIQADSMASQTFETEDSEEGEEI